jgi:NAD(P)-dependent dehydrogenase (short-subunit alcohol dehydrogenase family)
VDIEHSTALVTGANRGLGRHLATQLIARGATVYATARNPDTVDIAGAEVLRLDITDTDSVAAAVSAAGDVNVLINNAGSSVQASLLTGPLHDIHVEMDTHFYGTLAMIRGFAPVIAANGGGAILNVLSVLSWISFPTTGAYCAAKSAAWSMTNAVRQELAADNILVSALHVGYMDTDMAAHVTAPKSDPAIIATLALDSIAANEREIVADDISRHVQTSLAAGVTALYPDAARA